MKYKIPAGTQVNRGKALAKSERTRSDIFGREWENCVTTKDAYYTDRDVKYTNTSFIMFDVPDAPWNLVEVLSKFVVELSHHS